MDDIREWISDNLRYILLGLALILVLAVAILGIRAISNIAGGRSSSTAVNETESDTENDVVVETDAQTESGSLVKNDAKVLTTMTSYFAARTNGDTDTLAKLDPSSEETEQTNTYIESYSNVTTYSKEGPTTGSYVVYACYDGKVKDIDTLVPSLNQYFLKSNTDGSLYIADWEDDASAKAFVEETRASSEVQSLIDSVAQDLEEAEDSDPALKSFMAEYVSSRSSDTGDTQSSDGTELVANDNEINVRSEASTDGTVLGTLYLGDTVTKLGETDDGWTMIDYDGTTAYVKSEFLSEADAAETAETESETSAESAA